MRTNAIKKAAAVIGIAAAVAGLGACSAKPGVAVAVGDYTYSDADIQEGARQFAALGGQGAEPRVLAHQVGEWRLRVLIGEQLGLDLSDEVVAEQIQSLESQSGLKLGEEPGAVLSDFIRDRIVQTSLSTLQLSEEEITELNQNVAVLIENNDIEVNPRYGTINTEYQMMEDPVFGDVITSADLAESTAN